jgi:ribosomal protein S18 acetylase RimI-like enzyme
MQTEVELRRLGLEDYERIMDLWRRSGLTSLRLRGRDSRQAFAQQLESGVQTVLGLEQNERLIAVVVATHDSRKGWINRLTVDPDYRRRGHARRLLAAAEELFKELGLFITVALIEDWNEVSLKLFLQQGYRLNDDILYVSKRESDDV